MRVQPGNHFRPIAEIGDPRKEKISSALKKVERETCQQKKNAIELTLFSRCVAQCKRPCWLRDWPDFPRRQPVANRSRWTMRRSSIDPILCRRGAPSQHDPNLRAVGWREWPPAD